MNEVNERGSAAPLGIGLHFSALPGDEARLLSTAICVALPLANTVHLIFPPIDPDEDKPDEVSARMTTNLLSSIYANHLIPYGWGRSISIFLFNLAHYLLEIDDCSNNAMTIEEINKLLKLSVDISLLMDE